MTEEKKLPTIEEWFEENKNENDCAGMTMGFKSFLDKHEINKSLNSELGKYFLGEIFSRDWYEGLNFTLNLVLSKDKDGKIVYFIDESRVELV